MPSRRCAFATFVACTLLNTAAPAGESLFDDQIPATIHIEKAGENDELLIKQQKVDYHHIFQWGQEPGEKSRQIIARETIRKTINDQVEGEQSNLKVDLFFSGAGGKFPKTPSHSVTIENGSEAKFLDEGWIGTTFGCCDQENYNRFYTYGADDPFLRYNGDYWKVDVPNNHGKERYVAMAIKDQVANEVAKKVLFGKQPKAVACVQLGGGGKLLDVVYLQPRKGVTQKQMEDMSIHSDKLALKGAGEKDEVNEEQRELTLWSMDGAVEANKRKTAVGGFDVIASVDLSNGDESSTPTLKVAVENDKFVRPRVVSKWLEAVSSSSSSGSSAKE